MTLFEFLVPVVALAVAGAGAWLLRREARSIDRDLSRRHHPAE
ncbi:hypothetical protein [Frigidibacter sp. MR17.24]